MARINERCIEFTPTETKFDNREIKPGETIHSGLIDLHGAKIHVMWIRSSVPGVTVVFEYQTKNREVLQRSDEPLPIEHEKDLYCRFQFATYGKMQLPAPYILMKIHNTSDQVAVVRAYGVSQLQ